MRILIPSTASSKPVKMVRLFDSVMGHVFEHDEDPESKIVVAIKPPYAPAKYSVVETYVSPKLRNKGVASKLLKEVLSVYPHDIGAQCSSDESVRLFWKNGFRLIDGGSVNDALRRRKENSAVYLKRF